MIERFRVLNSDCGASTTVLHNSAAPGGWGAEEEAAAAAARCLPTSGLSLMHLARTCASSSGLAYRQQSLGNLLDGCCLLIWFHIRRGCRSRPARRPSALCGSRRSGSSWLSPLPSGATASSAPTLRPEGAPAGNLRPPLKLKPITAEYTAAEAPWSSLVSLIKKP